MCSSPIIAGDLRATALQGFTLPAPTALIDINPGAPGSPECP
jgi:hypothetical protein